MTGCALGPTAPPFLPTIPTWPTDWTMVPTPLTHAGRNYLIVAEPDWLAIGGYLVELERQLTASCLALGGTAAQCHVVPP